MDSGDCDVALWAMFHPGRKLCATPYQDAEMALTAGTLTASTASRGAETMQMQPGSLRCQHKPVTYGACREAHTDQTSKLFMKEMLLGNLLYCHT